MLEKNKLNSPILITVSGKDQPGITASLLKILSQSHAEILDMGQAVLHGHLSLSILFDQKEKSQESKEILKDLLFKAHELGVTLHFKLIEDRNFTIQKKLKKHRYVITAIGSTLSAHGLSEITSVLAQAQMNIDSIKSLSLSETRCIEFQLSSEDPMDPKKLKNRLLTKTQDSAIDLAVQEEGLLRKSKRMVVFDMDSTLIQNEIIDELAKDHKVFDQVSKITEEAMQGQMDFHESLKKRVALLKGLNPDWDQVFSRITLTHGAQELIQTLKTLGYKIAIISGGFLPIALKLKEKLEIDFVYANNLEENQNRLTGNLIGPIIDAQRKSDLMEALAKQEKISLQQVIAIGDGANDLLMIENSGLGIAFKGKKRLRERADLALNQNNLISILYLLGLSHSDILGPQTIAKEIKAF